MARETVGYHIIHLGDPMLSGIHLSALRIKMQVYTYLLGLWIGSHQEIWSLERGTNGYQTISFLSSLGKKRV